MVDALIGLAAILAGISFLLVLWRFIKGPSAVDRVISFDGLTIVMMSVITGVGFLIHVFSVGYIKDDPGYPRYFAYLNLFVFSMLVLVLATAYERFAVRPELLSFAALLFVLIVVQRYRGGGSEAWLWVLPVLQLFWSNAHTLWILGPVTLWIVVAAEWVEARLAPRIAIVGRPNVGKSTLANRLLGEESLVVFDLPGTTRDTIAVDYERDGIAYELIDTAGLHETDDPVEREGMRRARPEPNDRPYPAAIVKEPGVLAVAPLSRNRARGLSGVAG